MGTTIGPKWMRSGSQNGSGNEPAMNPKGSQSGTGGGGSRGGPEYRVSVRRQKPSFQTGSTSWSDRRSYDLHVLVQTPPIGHSCHPRCWIIATRSRIVALIKTSGGNALLCLRFQSIDASTVALKFQSHRRRIVFIRVILIPWEASKSRGLQGPGNQRAESPGQ